MVGQFRLQRSLQDCFRELFQKAVLADDVFRLLVIGQQLINECLVDGHRFPFSSSDGRLHSPFYTLGQISQYLLPRCHLVLRPRGTLAARGRSTEKSRVVIRCCKATTVPSVGQQRRVQPDRRNCLPQAQQKAQKLGKYLSSSVLPLPRRARTQQFAQDQAQIERAYMDQLPLQNVFVSAQMATPHPSRLVAVREAALD